MTPWWWSWLLTTVGVSGLWLAGNGRTLGWWIGVGAQALWLAYAVTTEQWGFLVSVGAYGTVFVRNVIKARRRDAEQHDK